MSSRLVVEAGARRLRADRALAAGFPEHSRSALQRAFAAGLVRRNGLAVGQSDLVRAGDLLEFSLPETRAAEMVPNPLPLDVLWEDDQVIAINKAAGMVVHPGASTGGDTLVHALLAHCAGTLSGVGGVERPGIVHRLDKETSGLILVAKTDAAHRGLAEQLLRQMAMAIWNNVTPFAGHCGGRGMLPMLLVFLLHHFLCPFVHPCIAQHF